MAGCRIEVKEMENATLNWGLVSTYRREIMGAASLLVMCCHSAFRWPDSLHMQIWLFHFNWMKGFDRILHY